MSTDFRLEFQERTFVSPFGTYRNETNKIEDNMHLSQRRLLSGGDPITPLSLYLMPSRVACLVTEPRECGLFLCLLDA